MESHVSGSGSSFLADRTPAVAGASHTHVTPADAGWERVSFRLDLLDAGGSVDRVADGEEIALVPISGRLKVDALGTSWTLGNRGSVFDGPPEALYLPLGTDYRVEAEIATEWATCGAACERVLQPKLVTSGDYSVEIRGAGNATRQVVTIVPPEFPSDRLLVVEVWTPAGNWSSYPPHKHDVLDMPAENRLEEIYHYRLQGDGGFALQRIYDPTRGVDETFAVRDGDTAIIPWGYHTTAAAPGYPLYYLNVLAGDEHSLNARNDESHSWVRDEWPQQDVDPRVPLFGPSA
jgi:5-deoxy-glucuronate isomerase